MNPSLAPSFDKALFAPCGMNCGTCLAYLREKNRCLGCWNKDESPRKSVVRCVIMNCSSLAETDSKFCYECAKYPCPRLKQLDKRYRTRYHVSLMDNLQKIKINGLDDFLKSEVTKWTCPACGGTICIHRGFCLICKSAN